MSAWGMGIALAIIAAAVVYIAVEIEDPQQAPVLQRQQSHDTLLLHARVLQAYVQSHNGAWPDSWQQLRRFSQDQENPDLQLHLLARAVPGGGIYEYRKPSQQTDIVMASTMIHEPLLASHNEQQLAEPAVHYVLNGQLQVMTLSDEEQRQLAPWLYEMETNT